MRHIQIPKVPNAVNDPFSDVCTIMESLCKERLNEEYFQLSVTLAAKIARKRPSPLLSGNTKTWAAGIIHTLGLVNFLFDKSGSPHMTSKELCEWFSLGQSTISAKSKFIREIFNICQLDPEWCLPSKALDNPLVWMVSFGGYIVDVRNAPYEIQQAAYEAGAIPFVPEQKDSQSS